MAYAAPIEEPNNSNDEADIDMVTPVDMGMPDTIPSRTKKPRRTNQLCRTPNRAECFGHSLIGLVLDWNGWGYLIPMLHMNNN